MSRTIEPLEIIHMLTRPGYEPISTHHDLRTFLTACVVKDHRGEMVSSLTLWSKDAPGLRLGQRFMNVIPDKYYDMLTGTVIDPYHKNDSRSIYIALDYIRFWEN